MDGSDRFIEPKTAGVAVGCRYRPSIDNLAPETVNITLIENNTPGNTVISIIPKLIN